MRAGGGRKLLVTSASLLGTSALLVVTKKLVVTSARLLETSALLVVTKKLLELRIIASSYY